MQKIKLLYVIAKFEQGGSERFLYEVCRAVDRNKFDIEILTRKHGADKDFYYPLLRDLGIKIHTRMPTRRYGLRRFDPSFPNNMPKVKAVLDQIHRWRASTELNGFFDTYDLVSFIQIDNFYPVQHLFKKQDRVVIHLMSNAFQYNYDYYQECEEDRFYNFVVMDPLQISELDGTKCENFQHIYFPLALDTSERPEVYSVPERITPIHIGIVMRLSINRPIEFFFYAFKDLLQHVDARLHIYGQGDPSMFSRVLDRLHIHDKVIFEGQQKDLQRVVENENLSMIWLTCNGPILGYASVEIANYGIPMVFWNLHNSSTEDVLNATDGAVHAFSHVSRFVEHTLSLLCSPESLRSAGDSMRSFVIKRYDIKHYIGELESYYQEIAVRFQ